MYDALVEVLKCDSYLSKQVSKCYTYELSVCCTLYVICREKASVLFLLCLVLIFMRSCTQPQEEASIVSLFEAMDRLHVVDDISSSTFDLDEFLILKDKNNMDQFDVHQGLEKGTPVRMVDRARDPTLGSWEDRPPAAYLDNDLDSLD
eukprot:1811597-Pyramimonas_sp.AAC.1